MISALRNPALFFGDVNAENDDLLSRAFFESPDYKTLIEHPKGHLVVGRRGTGRNVVRRRRAR